MNSTQLNIVKALIEQKKYDVITEYTHIAHPDKGDIIVKEYAGTGVRVYKDNDGNTRVLCPKDIDTVQEGHVAQAIANGTIFDDADEIDRNATMIERTSIPYDAMVNSGKDTPKQLKPMIAIVIGRMDDNGSFDVSDADRTNGVNFVHDLCDKDKCPNTNDVVDNYLEKDKEDFYNPEMGKSLTELDNEVDDIVETKPEDVVTNDDTVDSYDDYDMDAIESDPTPENDETESDEEDGDNDDVSDDTDSDDSDNDDDESEDNESSNNDDEEAVIEDVDDDDNESVEECGDIDTVQEDTEEMAAMVSGAMNKTPIPAESDLKPIQEEVGVERASEHGIIGASGLFLGLGQLRGMSGMCLMGETPGYFIDAEAAEALLNKLALLLNFEINTDKLDERAEETRQMIAKAQQMEQDLINKANAGNADDLRYIG